MPHSLLVPRLLTTQGWASLVYLTQFWEETWEVRITLSPGCSGRMDLWFSNDNQTFQLLFHPTPTRSWASPWKLILTSSCLPIPSKAKAHHHSPYSACAYTLGPMCFFFFLLVYRISFLDWDAVHIWWSPQYRMHMSVSSADKMTRLQAFWSAHANLQHPEFFLRPCTLISSLRGEHYSDFNFICSWTLNMNHATNLLAL